MKLQADPSTALGRPCACRRVHPAADAHTHTHTCSHTHAVTRAHTRGHTHAYSRTVAYSHAHACTHTSPSRFLTRAEGRAGAAGECQCPAGRAAPHLRVAVRGPRASALLLCLAGAPSPSPQNTQGHTEHAPTPPPTPRTTELLTDVFDGYYFVILVHL